MVVREMPDDVFSGAIDGDFVDDAKEGLTSQGGVFGAQVLFEALDVAECLFGGRDGDRSGGFQFELGKLRNEVFLFVFEGGEAFSEGVRIAVSGNGIRGVGDALSGSRQL